MAAIWHLKLSQEKHKAESVFPRPYNPQWRWHDTHCSFADVAHRSQKLYFRISFRVWRSYQGSKCETGIKHGHEMSVLVLTKSQTATLCTCNCG